MSIPMPPFMCTLTFHHHPGIFSVRRGWRWRGIGFKPLPDSKTWSCDPWPHLIYHAGNWGALWNERGELPSPFLPRPSSSGCHSALALSRRKSTFSWCGMNKLLQFIKFCYLRWLSLWGGLFSLYSHLLFLLCFLCPWYWNLELRILSPGLWARKRNVPSQAHIFLL